MIGQALQILLLGMGGVFVFLLVLIGLMHWIAKIFPPIPVSERPAPPPSDDELQLIAVLQAAIEAYEADHQVGN